MDNYAKKLEDLLEQKGIASDGPLSASDSFKLKAIAYQAVKEIAELDEAIRLLLTVLRQYNVLGVTDNIADDVILLCENNKRMAAWAARERKRSAAYRAYLLVEVGNAELERYEKKHGL